MTAWSCPTRRRLLRAAADDTLRYLTTSVGVHPIRSYSSRVHPATALPPSLLPPTPPPLQAVEAHAAKIWEEFQEVTADAEGLAARGNSIWVAAVRDDALAYGPEWRTLVLQDRGTWEPTNSRLFPRTTKIFTDLQGTLRCTWPASRPP